MVTENISANSGEDEKFADVLRSESCEHEEMIDIEVDGESPAILIVDDNKDYM